MALREQIFLICCRIVDPTCLLQTVLRERLICRFLALNNCNVVLWKICYSTEVSKFRPGGIGQGRIDCYEKTLEKLVDKF